MRPKQQLRDGGCTTTSQRCLSRHPFHHYQKISCWRLIIKRQQPFSCTKQFGRPARPGGPPASDRLFAASLSCVLVSRWRRAAHAAGGTRSPAHPVHHAPTSCTARRLGPPAHYPAQHMGVFMYLQKTPRVKPRPSPSAHTRARSPCQHGVLIARHVFRHGQGAGSAHRAGAWFPSHSGQSRTRS